MFLCWVYSCFKFIFLMRIVLPIQFFYELSYKVVLSKGSKTFDLKQLYYNIVIHFCNKISVLIYLFLLTNKQV